MRTTVAVLTLLVVLGFSSANAQMKFSNDDVRQHVEDAQRLAVLDMYAHAIEELRRAEIVAGITPQEYAYVQQALLAYMVRMRDYERALAQVQSMIRSDTGNAYQNVDHCLRLAVNLGRDNIEGECFSIAGAVGMDMLERWQAQRANRENEAGSSSTNDCRSWDCYVSPPRHEE